ncbi:MAG: methylated-DNA--[protein]-cysteine S-methyltransferase [Candidatus Hydrogenedentes bacterium]|nr:methylated-DNA--[protein]-cysteine S-methyltransferase [Candidatus Hydrogenedentota bacterium]
MNSPRSSRRAIETPPDPAVWQGILERDRRLDGLVYYGVTSTRIFCRPTCPSRRPRPDRVVIFTNTDSAKAAGFRPCKRCKPEAATSRDVAQKIVAAACAVLDGGGDTRVSIRAVASSAGVSERRLRELFDEVLGVSPARFADALRFARLRAALHREGDVTTAIYAAGFEAPSRVYETASRRLGMSPARYLRGAQHQRLSYTTVRCPLGYILVAATAKGLCHVSLGNDAQTLERDLLTEFPKAVVTRADAAVRDWAKALASYVEGRTAWPLLPVDVRGTAFQAKVWDVLRSIPEGETVTYARIADLLGVPKAARAVARACATNRVALAIPCHRVVPAVGGVGGYRWGTRRKAELLKREQRG